MSREHSVGRQRRRLAEHYRDETDFSAIHTTFRRCSATCSRGSDKLKRANAVCGLDAITTLFVCNKYFQFCGISIKLSSNRRRR